MKRAHTAHAHISERRKLRRSANARRRRLTIGPTNSNSRYIKDWAIQSAHPSPIVEPPELRASTFEADNDVARAIVTRIHAARAYSHVALEVRLRTVGSN